MQIDSVDLLSQFQADWPMQAELSQLRLLARLQDEEIQRLKAGQMDSAFEPRTYGGERGLHAG